MTSNTDWRAAWDAPLQPGMCEACGAVFLLPQAAQRLTCPNCLEDQLAPLIVDADAPEIYAPEALLPFSVDEAALMNQLTTFVRDIPLKPPDLSLAKLRARMQRVYVPLWWVDVEINALWQAEAGFEYDVVSHREVYSGGWQSQEVSETRLRWDPRAGQLTRPYKNVPVPALQDERRVRHQLGEFDMSQIQAYAPEALGENTLIRLPDRPPEDAWNTAQVTLKQRALNDLRVASQAAELREFRWTVKYENQNWTYVLMPVYVSYYVNVDRERHWVIIHGQTGRVMGERRANVARARLFSGGIFTVAAVLLGLSLVLFLLGINLLSGLLLLVGGALAMVAPIPFFRAWRFNRKQPDDEQTRLLS